jgi:hypothetical protein
MALYRGDYAQSMDLFVNSLSMPRELGDRRGIAKSLDGLGGVAAVPGRAPEPARLFGVADPLARKLAPLLPRNRWVDAIVVAAREQLGDEAWRQTWTEGRGLAMEALLSSLI